MGQLRSGNNSGNARTVTVTVIEISLTIYRGHLGPFGPKSEKKSRKGFLGNLGPGGPKSQENNRKLTIFQVFFQVFINPVFDSFLTFWAPEAEGTPFRDFFRTSGRKA